MAMGCLKKGLTMAQKAILFGAGSLSCVNNYDYLRLCFVPHFSLSVADVGSAHVACSC